MCKDRSLSIQLWRVVACEVRPPVGSTSCAGDVRGSIVIDTVVESSCGMLNITQMHYGRTCW
ncbi:hypothetical protein J6590_065018 [Homalodisca vitripennis]|nr:hypothetical protein J6590_065018 [Homalodisca vitripennis]